MDRELADYIADNYGTCTSNLCKCLLPGHPWLGRLCQNWQPVKAKTWANFWISMSVKAVTWALAQELPPVPKLVLIALCERANIDTGECWPGIATVAKDACLSERSVVTYIAALVRNGFVERQQMRGKDGRKRSNHYWIQFDRDPAPWIGPGGKIEEIPPDEADETEPPESTSNPHANPAHGDHTQTVAHGPHATACTLHIMTEPEVLEPEESKTRVLAEQPPPRAAAPAVTKAPKGFSKTKQQEDIDRLKQAEEARKAQPIPVIEGSAPWEAWCRHGHPRSLVGKISVNGRLDRGWCFPSLYPPREDSS